MSTTGSIQIPVRACILRGLRRRPEAEANRHDSAKLMGSAMANARPSSCRCESQLSIAETPIP
jgi:hypothetical protein